MRLILALIIAALFLWHLVSIHRLENSLNICRSRLRDVQLAAWHAVLMSESDRFAAVHRIAIDSGFALEAAGFDASLSEDLREAVRHRIALVAAVNDRNASS